MEALFPFCNKNIYLKKSNQFHNTFRDRAKSAKSNCTSFVSLDFLIKETKNFFNYVFLNSALSGKQTADKGNIAIFLPQTKLVVSQLNLIRTAFLAILSTHTSF